MFGSPLKLPRLTLLGRATLLLTLEVLANALCWAVAALLFARDPATQSVLSLALLAWTIGLRHALDADHISAIDNATRGLLSLGQTPVTCGLFFSLGHSTVVVAVNVAIAASTDVARHLDGVGSVGGIIGASVSASFLFLIGLANTVILVRTLRRRRRKGEVEGDGAEPHANTLMMKIIGPVVRFVDVPWKMYPVGLLFGLGFDTASSIALLAVSAIAKKDALGRPIPPAYIVILPLLFTAAMTLVDSLDSVLMLYSYAGFPRSRSGWTLLDKKASDLDAKSSVADVDADVGGLPVLERDGHNDEAEATGGTRIMPPRAESREQEYGDDSEGGVRGGGQVHIEEREPDSIRLKRHLMSNLSVVLTAMSIVVAFSISLITIMGLIGENCARCARAADAEDGTGGGLEGSWWRFWATVNDNSGYIGAGIVGSFVLVVGVWYGAGRIRRRQRRCREGDA